MKSIALPAGYQWICACSGLFGIFWFRLAYFYVLFGIFCSVGPGNPEHLGGEAE